MMWLKRLFFRRRLYGELSEEIREHLEEKIEELVATGMSRKEATYGARREFGNVALLEEDSRAVWQWPTVEGFFADLRYGVRILHKTPAVTCVALLSLALGIGANTAIFSLMDGLMLRLLPVQKPEELLQVLRTNPSAEPGASFTNKVWEQIRDTQDVFSGTFAWWSDRFDLAKGGEAHYANGLYVNGDYFRVLGIRPAGGRLISFSDDWRGCPGVVALSYGFWREHFGGSQSVIGSTLSLNNHPFAVIGVAAPGFFGTEVGNRFDVALPICAEAIVRGKDSALDNSGAWWLQIMGRLKPGVNQQQAAARFKVLGPATFAAALPKEEQQYFAQRTLVVVPGAAGPSDLRDQYKRPLETLMIIVGLVLLIACANIAGLMLARAAAREREIAMRKALGASRARLIRQLLTECVLLSTTGALPGILFACWGTALLVRYISTAQNKVFLDLSLDSRVLAFTAATAVLTGILVGVLPALRSTRVSLAAAMKGSQAVGSERRIRFRPGKWIVASQVALSLVLLVAAGLFLRSFVNLVTLDIGFDRNNLLVMNTNLKIPNISPEQWSGNYDQIESRLRSLPGVVSVGRSIRLPISNWEWNQSLHVDSPGAPTGEDSLAYFNFISPGFFQTMRIPMLAGRNFDNYDSKTTTPVAIVNEVLARRFFPNANPIGKYFRMGRLGENSAPPVQIVGLVKDSKYESLREDTYAQAFFPIAQVPEHDEAENFLLRTVAPPSTLVSVVQDAVASSNTGISLEFHTLAEQVDDSLVQERLLATLSAFCGALALLLAMVGLYGAMSYLVTQRQAEFGIRRALGAQPVSILQLVMRDVAAVLLWGLTAGVAISVATAQLLQRMLFGLPARDAFTLTVAVVTFSAVALLAGYLPARRAMRVDPIVALRYE